MKPRKTRIKVTTKVDGKVVHMPQHKGLFFWYDFNDREGWSALMHTNAFTIWHQDGGSSGCGFGTLEHAQELIDTYIERFNKEEHRRAVGNVVNVKYIKYP